MPGSATVTNASCMPSASLSDRCASASTDAVSAPAVSGCSLRKTRRQPIDRTSFIVTARTTTPTTMPEVVKDAVALNGRGAVVAPARDNGFPPRARKDWMCRPRAASASSAVRQAKITKAAPATRIGECRRGPEPSRLLRFLVTSPQNNCASEPTPASPAMVNSTLSTTDAGPDGAGPHPHHVRPKRRPPRAG